MGPARITRGLKLKRLEEYNNTKSRCAHGAFYKSSRAIS